MRHLYLLPVVLAFGINLCFAQDQKNIKDSWADLKKSFKPDKAFIYPSHDSTDADLQAFLLAVQETKGVYTAVLKMTPKGAAIIVDAKGSMVNVWSNLPAEFRNRYTIRERTGDGFIMADKYNNSSPGATAAKKQNSGSNGSNTASENGSIYEQVEMEVNENYKPDTTKRKSVWDQQKEHADEMRKRDRKRNLGIMDYENPKEYDKKASAAKGLQFIEYKVNGKPFGISERGGNNVTTISSKTGNHQEYQFWDLNNNKRFFIKFTNPALYPDIRKFEFGKPSFKTTRANTYGSNTTVDLFFNFEMKIAGPTASTVYYIDGAIKPGDRSPGNIVSGTFEVIYFEPGTGGIIDARFSLVIKGGTDSKGKPQPDLIITDGRLKAQMRQ